MGDVRSAAPTRTPVVVQHEPTPPSSTRTTAAGIVLGALVAVMLCLRLLIYARRRWVLGRARTHRTARTVRIPDPIPMARVAEASAVSDAQLPPPPPPPDGLAALTGATKGDALPAYGIPVAVAVVVHDSA